jgi:galactokinase
MTEIGPFISTAPGRLCLFGEHQDYLNLPVIALALPLSCSIRVTPRRDSRSLILRFESKVWHIPLDRIPPKQVPGNSGDDLDFALAAVHEVMEGGWVFHCGADCISSTTIPLQAGISSSSAFCVAWIQVLAKLADHQPTLTPLEVAQWAHRAEVTHFGSPGGTMDHVTSAIGGILRIGPGMWDYQRLTMPQDGVWVLAYSGERKDTLHHLHRCKGLRLKLLEKLGGSWDNVKEGLSNDESILLQATMTNRDMEQHAATEWESSPSNVLASYMGQHHAALRDGLFLSTPRLEAMNQAALKAGAWAFKVVGSGGGGCGVAWCYDGIAESVALAMKQAGAPVTWIISDCSRGASVSYDNTPEY